MTRSHQLLLQLVLWREESLGVLDYLRSLFVVDEVSHVLADGHTIHLYLEGDLQLQVLNHPRPFQQLDLLVPPSFFT